MVQYLGVVPLLSKKTSPIVASTSLLSLYHKFAGWRIGFDSPIGYSYNLLDKLNTVYIFIAFYSHKNGGSL